MKTRYRSRNRTISGSVLTPPVYKRLEPDVSRMFFHAERKGSREPRSRLRLDVVFPLVPPSFFFFFCFLWKRPSPVKLKRRSFAAEISNVQGNNHAHDRRPSIVRLSRPKSEMKPDARKHRPAIFFVSNARHCEDTDGTRVTHATTWSRLFIETDPLLVAGCDGPPAASLKSYWNGWKAVHLGTLFQDCLKAWKGFLAKNVSAMRAMQCL